MTDNGRPVVVTGGSRGIGRATVLALAARGYPVCINYLRSRGEALALARQVRAAGPRALVIQADVSQYRDVERMFRRCVDGLGGLHGLVNNAGVIGKLGPLVAMDRARLRRVLDVNILGAMLCAQAALHYMTFAQGGSGGSIVNVSSVASRLGAPGAYVDYAASKAAIDTFTIGLAKEVALQGVRVNAVRPGFIDTAIHEGTGDSARTRNVVAEIPIGRIGTPEEVANAIAWLLSAEASYATGTILDVSGGR